MPANAAAAASVQQQTPRTLPYVRIRDALSF
jgi:hypothetical protein